MRGWLLVKLSVLTVTVSIGIALATLGMIRWRYGPGESGLRLQATVFVANFIENAYELNGPRGIESLKNWGAISPTLQFHWWIIDDTGRVAFSGQDAPAPREVAAINGAPGPLTLHLERFRTWTTSVKLRVPANHHLVLQRNEAMTATGRALRNIAVIVGLLTIFGTATVSLFAIVIYLRSRAKEAREIISQLQAGRLSARFKVQKTDEVGGLMAQFNSMAVEIERLVSTLKQNEHTKTEMLQELGHDLRTPLASIQNLLEILHDNEDAFAPSARREHLDLCLAELSYIKKLLEDLFFIAEMTEPKYHATTEQVSLVSLVREEAEQFSRRLGPALPVDVSIQDALSESFNVLGDGKLLQRMIRNLLNNAKRFAKHGIGIVIGRSHHGVRLIVRDDGPGFTREGLEHFGNRQKARQFPTLSQGEISTGLGSVIVKSIAAFHGAEIQVSNWKKPDGHVGGAEVSIVFPKAA